MSEPGQPPDHRRDRLGLNEALFRTLNDELDKLNDAFATRTDDFEVVCECGNADCVDRISLPVSEYERVRDDRTLFILAPGHEDATAEAVVEQHRPNFVIVRKLPGGPAELAAGTAGS